MRRWILAFVVFAIVFALGCSGEADDQKSDNEPTTEGRNSPLNEETDEVERVRKQVMGED